MRRRSGRTSLARILILLVFLGVGIALLLPYVSMNRFKPDIESALSRQLGRTVTVGNIHLGLSRGPALVLEDFRAQEDPSFGSTDTIQAQRVKVGLAVGPLVNRQLVPTSLQLEQPRFTFTRDSRGTWSWATLGSRSGQSEVSQNPSAPVAGPSGVHAVNFVAPGRADAAALTLTTPPGSADAGSLKLIELHGASFTFVQQGPDNPRRVVFNDIDLRAALTPEPAEAEPTTRAVGTLRASSEQSGGAELLTADLPFDVAASASDSGGFSISGTVGPGAVRTSSFAAQEFKSSITLNGKIARFDDIEAGVYEGQVNGGVQLDLSAANPRFAVEGKLNNVNIDQSVGTLLGIPGAITGHISGDFKLIALMADLPRCFQSMSGDGRLSSDDLFVSNVNLSEQVARRLGMAQIGNMSAGTNVGHIDEQFRISGGSITIQDLHLKQLDGLGDATSDRATIEVSFADRKPNVRLDFPTTVTLSQEAADAARQASPLFALAAALLERSNQVTIPIRITGDVLNPQVLVDLPRILQSLGQG